MSEEIIKLTPLEKTMLQFAVKHELATFEKTRKKMTGMTADLESAATRVVNTLKDLETKLL